MAAMASPKSPKSPKAPPMIPGLVNHEMTQKELEEISQQKMDVPSGPAPPAGSNPGVQSQLELLLHKVDVCLTEILNVKSMAGKESENLFGAKKGGKKSKVSWGNFPDSEPSLRQTAIPERQETETYDSAVSEDGTNGARASEWPTKDPKRETGINRQSEWPTKDPKRDTGFARQSEWPSSASKNSSPPASGSEKEEQVNGGGNSPVHRAGRAAIVAGGVDLHVAWKLQAKKITQMDPGVELTPMMRLVERSTLEIVWEFLDDQDSSRGAWWACLFLRTVVVVSLLLSLLQNTEEQIMDPVATAVWETSVDVLFVAEFLARVISSPYKRTYFLDPFNWADMLTVLALPLRISTGFVLESSPVSPAEDAVHVILKFAVPLVRFLKLLRYFEVFRLLIDAFKNSAESLPVLAYIMSLIALVGATLIYLAEERRNIPSLQHAMWLAIVTMTSVGYGDFFPETLAGYLVVSFLTFVSVLFLALPVGIIGHEFTASWNSRHKVLLITKVRKCLEKWGYSAKDVKVLFDYVDVNGDGSLNLSEFIELIRQMRIGISVESAFNIFSLFDDDQSGSLDSTEFLRHIFPEEYVKAQQEQQTPVRKSRAVAGMALQHLEHLHGRPSQVRASRLSDQ
ncbi:Potassium voltage-gated channel subfamily B member 2 (Voltage-gated potassium channel subunit Kv2.2) [Durusdinium trenchii]|uniref:Potassium voltage-gated channel subfamily B member 2 (Voltage-gated potassium channel subunit Kv2.2) n=1 Tax=Durusdinium trenchii TaxID=1381693 RepID=A0ABP0IF20_9DINO